MEPADTSVQSWGMCDLYEIIAKCLNVTAEAESYSASYILGSCEEGFMLLQYLLEDLNSSF